MKGLYRDCTRTEKNNTKQKALEAALDRAEWIENALLPVLQKTALLRVPKQSVEE